MSVATHRESASSLSPTSTRIDLEGMSNPQEGTIERLEDKAEDLATIGDVDSRNVEEFHDQPRDLPLGTSPIPSGESSIPLHRSSTKISIKSEKPGNHPPNPNDLTETSPTPPFPPVHRATTSGSEKPYSAFSLGTRWLIVGLGGIAAIFSPISSNIFVPAIPILSTDFGKTNEEISLGVTVYLIFQAITPSFFGSMSDTFGRRPIYIGTLVLYIGSNIGLALMPTSAYWLLLFLRALQATGGSAVISIGAGCVADVAEPRERGTFMAIFQAGAMIGPAFGPLLGGVFASTLGWRSIFWFLTIATGVVLVPLILFMPETLRSLVGDGSIPPPALNSSPAMLIRRRRMQKAAKEAGEKGEAVVRPPKKKYKPLSAFLLLFTPEIVLMFIFASFMYLEFYCVLTVFSTVLSDVYKLTELQIGLCYLSAGIGAVFSTVINGKQIDYYYRKEEKRVGGDYRKKSETFRLDLTRIRCIAPFMVVFLVACTALGWCLEAHAPLSATLVVNFFIGLGSGTLGTVTVYGQDIKPGQGGAVSASFNLVRCIFGAVGTAVVQILYNAIGAGWTFVLLSGLCVATIPIPVVVIKYGPRWREKRRLKEERKKVSREEKEREAALAAIDNGVEGGSS